MPYQPNYPSTVAEVIDPDLRFKRETVRAVKEFARSKPWRGSLNARIAKFRRLHDQLKIIYNRRTALVFNMPGEDRGDSGSSYYRPSEDVIVLQGRLSVVTYLHEFGHALGKDERQTCKWSINLFAKCFPRSFARCSRSGHTLRRSSAGEQSRPVPLDALFGLPPATAPRRRRRRGDVTPDDLGRNVKDRAADSGDNSRARSGRPRLRLPVPPRPNQDPLIYQERPRRRRRRSPFPSQASLGTIADQD